LPRWKVARSARVEADLVLPVSEERGRWHRDGARSDELDRERQPGLVTSAVTRGHMSMSVFSATPASLDFGDVVVGTTATKAVTLDIDSGYELAGVAGQGVFSTGGGASVRAAPAPSTSPSHRRAWAAQRRRSSSRNAHVTTAAAPAVPTRRGR
jgi:hypothetical protein